tara:strand:- start:26 stop:331 length:306 start_codon:yes stop_codon:yes gene_type:complete
MKQEPKKLGRPVGNGKKKAKPSLSIHPDLIAQLEDARDKTGIPVSALVTACCKLRLPKLLRDLLENDPCDKVNLEPKDTPKKEVKLKHLPPAARAESPKAK